MKQNIKRQVYLISFTFLGLLLGLLAEAIIELCYTTLLLADFNRFSFGLSWSGLFQIRNFLAAAVILGSGWWGYSSGVYWWHQIYELKIFSNRQWFKKNHMKKLCLALAAAIITIGLLVFLSINYSQNDNNSAYQPTTIATTMKIQSTAFKEGGLIPVKYTCKGQGLNPDLDFSGVPPGTKSLAMIMDDPDAPMGTFVHWVVYNMPPQTTMIRGNSKPPGIQAKNGAGTNKYIGPCPPSGTHRYYFKVYALDIMLPANSILAKADLVRAMQGHIIEQAQLMAKFSH